MAAAADEVSFTKLRRYVSRADTGFTRYADPPIEAATTSSSEVFVRTMFIANNGSAAALAPMFRETAGTPTRDAGWASVGYAVFAGLLVTIIAVTIYFFNPATSWLIAAAGGMAIVVAALWWGGRYAAAP